MSDDIDDIDEDVDNQADGSGEASLAFGHANVIFCVYRLYMESISKEMNNDNDLNLHSMTKLSGWLRYWLMA